MTIILEPLDMLKKQNYSIVFLLFVYSMQAKKS